MSRALSLSILLLFSTAAVSLSAQEMPVYDVMPVEAVLTAEGTSVWDFSRCERAGRDVPVRVVNQGDSLLTVSTPSVRCRYMIDGDSLKRLSVENRFYQLIDDSAPVVATPLRLTPLVYRTASSGMAFHSDSLRTTAKITLHPDLSGIFIGFDSDTIPGVVLRHCTERMEGVYGKERKAFLQYKETYTWVHPSASFPLARTEEIRDSVGGREVSRSVNSWVLTDRSMGANATRPETQKVAKSPLNGLRGNSPEDLIAFYNDNSARHSSALGRIVTEAAVAQNGDEISVIFTETGKSELTSITNGSQLTVILTDTLGRVRSTSTHSSTVTPPRIHAATLPAGEYLLYVATDTDSAVKKIILH